MNQKEFGELIKLKRKEKNLTQSELSEKLGLSSYKTISKWENGIYMPDISLLTRISEILDVSLYELLGGKEKENMKKENVEEVLKNAIKKANDKNKMFLLKTLLIILTIILLTISSLFIYRLYKDHDYLFITKPENIDINDINYNHAGILWYDTDIIKYGDFFTYYHFGEKNIGIEEAIIQKLPLYKTKKGFAHIYPNERSIVYVLGNKDFEQTEDDINENYNDKLYTKKAMFVNSLVLFNKIDNLESVIFKYTNATYEIDIDDLKKHYDYISETYMCDNDSCNYSYHITFNGWQKDVIAKLRNYDFLNDFFKKTKIHEENQH